MRIPAIFLFLQIFIANISMAYDVDHKLWSAVRSPSTLEIIIYPVKGQNVEELKKQMLLLGPQAVNGKRHYASTRWQIAWKWDNQNGKADYTNAEIDPKIMFVLPVLVGDAEPSLRVSWDQFYQSTVKHELQHAEHALKAALEIEALLSMYKAMQTPPAAEAANLEIMKLIDKARNLDRQYDQQTVHGKTENPKSAFLHQEI